MVKEDDIEKGDPKRVLTTFISVPHGIDKKSRGIVDVQGDWSSTEMARMQLYHRSIAMRLKMIKGNDDKDKNAADIPNDFADLFSMMTWGKDRKSRVEAVTGLIRLVETKIPYRMERLEDVEYKPPKGEEG